jgi:hypothetical protein
MEASLGKKIDLYLSLALKAVKKCGGSVNRARGR